MFTVLSLLGGLMFLAMGTNFLIRGTAGFANLAGVAPFLIGLVVVGFGTSTPQLFTAIQATQSGAIEMALATAVGASIFNIFATLGLVALGGGAVHLNWRLWVRGSLGLAILALISAVGLLYFTYTNQPIPRWGGVLSIVLLGIYTVAAYAYDHKNPTPLPLLKEIRKLHPVVLAGLFAAGLFCLVLGANLLVDAATQLSKIHTLNPRFLGLTVLAIGTAVPQLAASLMAYREKQHVLLLNNLIGNTIFNLLGVCGLLFAFSPITIHRGSLLLTSFIVLAAAAIAFAIFTHPAMRRFKRAEAILFLLAYAIYLAYLLHTL
jgi:cation:H+ antiporter